MTDKEEVCYNLCHERGDIAQLGERCVRIAEVGGSNPPISNKTLSKTLGKIYSDYPFLTGFFVFASKNLSTCSRRYRSTKEFTVPSG